MYIMDILHNVVEKSDMWVVDRKDGWVTLFKSNVEGIIFFQCGFYRIKCFTIRDVISSMLCSARTSDCTFG